MIRAALIHILLGVGLGVLMYVSYRVPGLSGLLAWRTAHVHLILLGGVIQMIMGVALWMFPRYKGHGGRPSEAQGWALFAMFNLGSVLRTVVTPYVEETVPFYVGLAGVLLQVAGLVFFFVLIIGRVRGPQSDF
jgi:hypothetical protein